MDFNALLLIGSGVILPVLGWIFRLQQRIHTAESEAVVSAAHRVKHDNVLSDIAVLKALIQSQANNMRDLDERIMGALERIERKLDLKADKRAGS
jgi:hypothetical protein